ncbi:hypothetical protein C1646_756276 [Rhizophagus diaphanus]|nr:hypothetical protein C1646_756276 [Rhizophagus diaphanus] [Rhizophagus sp. MUCL 43196]
MKAPDVIGNAIWKNEIDTSHLLYEVLTHGSSSEKFKNSKNITSEFMNESVATGVRCRNVIRDQTNIYKLIRYEQCWLEVIHAKYDADRVGNDLFIKYDGCAKEAIHRRLANLAEAHNPAWYVVNHGICIVEGIERRPDVGVWYTQPTCRQCIKPIVYKCPPRRMGRDRDHDRANAINRITHAQQHWIGIEYIDIAISESICRNPNPRQASIAAIAQNNISNRPLYAIHWDANNNQI